MWRLEICRAFVFNDLSRILIFGELTGVWSRIRACEGARSRAGGESFGKLASNACTPMGAEDGTAEVIVHYLLRVFRGPPSMSRPRAD